MSAAAPARRHTDLCRCNRSLNWSHIAPDTAPNSFLAFVALLAARKPEAVALINQLTYHFAMGLAPESTVPEDVQRHIVTCLRGLAGHHSAAMVTVFGTLPAPAQAAITAALSGAPTAAPGSPAGVAPPSPPA